MFDCLPMKRLKLAQMTKTELSRNQAQKKCCGRKRNWKERVDDSGETRERATEQKRRGMSKLIANDFEEGFGECAIEPKFFPTNNLATTDSKHIGMHAGRSVDKNPLKL